LVLASAEYHQPSMASFFERFNIPVIFLNPTSVATALSGIHLLGQIVDQEKRANYLVDSLANKAIQISDSTQGQIKYKTAIVVSTDPIRVAGGGSFQQDFMKYAGAENVFAKLPARYPEISSEDLVKAAPEYLLFAMDDDQAYANLVAVAPELHLSLPAAQNKHVYQLEPELLMTPGPRLLEGIAYLIRILHARIQIDGILRPDF